MAVTRWIPLESNPEVLNRFASVIGLNVASVTFCDVFGLDKVSPSFVFYPRKMQEAAWWIAPQMQTTHCSGVAGQWVWRQVEKPHRFCVKYQLKLFFSTDETSFRWVCLVVANPAGRAVQRHRLLCTVETCFPSSQGTVDSAAAIDRSKLSLDPFLKGCGLIKQGRRFVSKMGAIECLSCLCRNCWHSSQEDLLRSCCCSPSQMAPSWKRLKVMLDGWKIIRMLDGWPHIAAN